MSPRRTTSSQRHGRIRQGHAKDILFISVESRKGGVGKTTAALNIAKAMLDQQRSVLFLDADITGTNVAHVLKSPFWKDHCEPVSSASNGAAKSHPPDLLDLFSRVFMSGKGAPKFTADKSRIPKGYFGITSDKVNVLGSDQASADDPYPPSVLFDDLHSSLFIEFLQQLCESFVHAAPDCTTRDRGVAIIIDNSPGYAGIALAVREWLTDLGPKRGKFIFVASLDSQDLISCNDSMKSVHKLYCDKWHASRAFAKLSSGRSDPHLSKNGEPFFFRLTEVEDADKDSSIDSISGGALSFYLDPEDDCGRHFLDKHASYISLVINRVPDFIKSSRADYDIGGLLEHEMDQWVGPPLLPKPEVALSFFDIMVSYRQSIELQFSGSWIKRNGRRRRFKGGDIVHYLRGFIASRRQTWYKVPVVDTSPDRPALDCERLEALRSQVHAIDNDIEKATNTLATCGMSDMARLVAPDWRPSAIVRQFQDSLRDALAPMDVGSHDIFFQWEEETGPVNNEAVRFVEGLYCRLSERLREPSTDYKLGVSGPFLASLVPLVALSLTSPLWHDPSGKNIVELCAAVVLSEAQGFAGLKQRQETDISVARFLAIQSESERLANEFNLAWSKIHLEPESFLRFYRVCAMCQARLIDLREDATFILEVICCLAEYASSGDTEQGIVVPVVEDIVAEVVISKSRTHRHATSEIKRSFMGAFEMREFRGVLDRIIKTWKQP